MPMRLMVRESVVSGVNHVDGVNGLGLAGVGFIDVDIWLTGYR